MNTIIKIKMKKDTYTRWGVGHGMTVFKAHDPWEYFNTLKNYSLKNISHEIKQDFLLLASTKDHFIPEADFAKQIAVLTSVKSLTARLFTEYENAENHVQFGNLPLAVDVMSNWIHERSAI